MNLHVIKNPTGTYSYVGDIPYCLGKLVRASKSDIMGGRVVQKIDDVPFTIKFPVFETRQAAVDYARGNGCYVKD